MKLLTKEILNNFKKQGDTSQLETDKIKVIAKFFTPDANATWYATEYYPENEEFFGYCDLGLGFPELGYFSLKELKTVRGRLGLPIERDRFFKATLADVLEKRVQ